MKTNFRVWALGAGFASLVLCVGCRENQANAHPPLAVTAAPVYALAGDSAEGPVPVVKNEAPPPSPALVAPPAVAPAVAPAAAPASIVITQAPAATPAPAVTANAADPGPAAPAAGPPKVSPALAEVVRLLQANVNQDILFAYITNSTQPFYIGANEIVYLHDLGAPPAIVTSLIQMDSTPEMQARKQAALAVKPLPPGVALTEPAPNLYAPRAGASNPPEPLPVNPPPNNGSAFLSPPPPDTTVTYDYPQPAAEVNYGYFYSSLAPYGSWSDVPGYGSCWRPACATWNSSWRPYADAGRWLWSDHGWYWYSDYSWGWAPFHYGRWCQPAGYGWVWQPDTSWGPSWVSWRYSPNYCGWAPLPPSASYVSGLGFYYNGGSVGIGFEFGLGAADYCYIPSARFCDPHPYHHYLPQHQSQIVYKETTVINNYVLGNNNRIVNNGVGLDKISRVTRGDVRRVALRDTTSLKDLGTRHDRLEVDGATLTVYRPPTSTLARKSFVPASGQPSVSVSRPSSPAKSVTTVRGSSLPGASYAPASAAPSTGANNYRSPAVVNSRTTPTPVTVYTKPSSAGSEPVIVTGGVAPTIPYVKPESPRPSKTTAGSFADIPRNGSLRATRPDSASGAPGRVTSLPSSVEPLKSPYRPPTPSSAVSAGSAGPSPRSGYVSRDPASVPTRPVVPQPSAVQSSSGYSRPVIVSPAHNPGYAAGSSGYVAPSRVESHHSQVPAPSSARSSGSSGSSGSQGKSSDSSGDSKKGR